MNGCGKGVQLVGSRACVDQPRRLCAQKQFCGFFGRVLDLPERFFQLERAVCQLRRCGSLFPRAGRAAQRFDGGADCAEGGFCVVHCVRRLIEGGACGGCRVFAPDRSAVDLCKDAACAAECVAEPVARVSEVAHDGFQAVEGAGHTRAEFVDRVNGAVSKIGCPAREIMCAGAHGFELPVERVGVQVQQVAGARGLVAELAQQAAQGIEFVVQLLKGVLVELQQKVGFNLPGNTAYVLAPVYRAVVAAAVEEAGLPPDDAADVVAGVGIADGAIVFAALKDAGGIACDAAGIGVGAEVFGGIHVVPVPVVKGDADFLLAGVDLGAADAGGRGAEVLAGDAAGEMLAGNAAGDRAGVELAGAFVAACDAADAGFAADRAAERAALDHAAVAACDAADVFGAARGGDLAGDVQVAHLRALLDIAEEAHCGAALGEGKAGNGVPAAVEGAAEGRDWGKVRAG